MYVGTRILLIALHLLVDSGQRFRNPVHDESSGLLTSWDVTNNTPLENDKTIYCYETNALVAMK